MPELLERAYLFAEHSPAILLAVIALLVAAIILFLGWFVAPWGRVSAHIKRLSRQILTLKDTRGIDPRQIEIGDRRLRHLWIQYCDTLHLPKGALNPVTGVAEGGHHRATVPAETIFNPQSVFEGRIHSEFFKHLPGLLTGLGIIGTFVGLINGLGQANQGGGALDTDLLIGAVKEAFYVSAAAIALAMVVTFVEKLIVANLHRAVEQLCQDIDALYSSGAGEEYLSRLVHASEESASQARILKDALVGELSSILERLTQQQIEASSRQQAELRHHLVAAIDQGIRQPLGELAQGFGHMRSQQGDQLTQGLQDSMAAFAQKLDLMLGGQIGQAKDLQAQTLKALESAIDSFQSMARQVGAVGENATTSMSAQLSRSLDEMADRQTQMGDAMRTLADDMRVVLSSTQSDTGAHVGKLLAELGDQVGVVIDRLQSQSQAIGASHQDHMTELTSQTKETIDGLAAGVRAQTAAIEQTTLTMGAAIRELGNSVHRNVALMAEGAGEMRQAAEQFSGSGRAMSDMLDRTRAVSSELAQMTSTLAGSAEDVRIVVGDYRAARDSFAEIVGGLRDTVAIARREVSMTSELVAGMEAAAQKLVAAQGEADAYLAKLNEVLIDAHGSFSSQMLETLRRTNTEFHDHLTKSTSLLASTIAELDGAIIEFNPRKRAAG